MYQWHYMSIVVVVHSVNSIHTNKCRSTVYAATVSKAFACIQRINLHSCEANDAAWMHQWNDLDCCRTTINPRILTFHCLCADMVLNKVCTICLCMCIVTYEVGSIHKNKKDDMRRGIHFATTTVCNNLCMYIKSNALLWCKFLQNLGMYIKSHALLWCKYLC